MSKNRSIPNNALADKITKHVKGGSTERAGKSPVPPAATLIQHEHIKQKQIIRQSCLKVAGSLVAAHPQKENPTTDELVEMTTLIAEKLEQWVYGTEAN